MSSNNIPPTFKDLDYLNQNWCSQADRPLAEMSFYQRSHVLAELAFACYWAEGHMEVLSKHIGFTEQSYLNFDGAQAYIVSNEHDTIVTCRGTEATDWNDIRADLKVWKVLAETAGKVHGGFKRETDDLWPALEEALRANKKPLYFTGHSLGAAMALICAGRCQRSEIESNPLEIHTFGSPRVGDKRYISQAKVKHVRWVNNNDIVSRSPPAFFGYRHVGEEHYIDRHLGINETKGFKRTLDGLADFFKGITKARADHFMDHFMPGYVAPIVKAYRPEKEE